MNDQEIGALIRMVKALCPAQRFDEFTPDAWLVVLDDVSFDDARAALKPLVLAQPFIVPTDIARHVQRVRNDRIERFKEELLIPNAVDGVSYAEELRAVRRAIADGVITTEEDAETYRQWGGSLHQTYQAGQTPQLEPSPDAKPLRSRPVERAIENVFPRTDLRRALPPPATRRTEPPKWATARCPVCDAAPGALCILPDSDPPIRRQDPHTRRLRAAYSPDNPQGLPEGPETP